MLDSKAVFQVKNLSGWDTVEVGDIEAGQKFRVLVDNIPLIKEDGSMLFEAIDNPFLYEGEMSVPIK